MQKTLYHKKFTILFVDQSIKQQEDVKFLIATKAIIHAFLQLYPSY